MPAARRRPAPCLRSSPWLALSLSRSPLECQFAPGRKTDEPALKLQPHDRVLAVDGQPMSLVETLRGPAGPGEPEVAAALRLHPLDAPVEEDSSDPLPAR